jgi:hypothetical protein
LRREMMIVITSLHEQDESEENGRDKKRSEARSTKRSEKE